MTTQGPQGTPPGMGGEAEPSEEELRAAFEEQMRRVSVHDVLIQTTATLINLAAMRLGLAPGVDPADRDLEQARVAIEGARALIPLLPADIGQLREALSQLQMAYAREAQGAEASGPGAAAPEPAPPSGAPEAGAGSPAAGPAPGGGGTGPAPDEAERAKARAKIWTPGRG